VVLSVLDRGTGIDPAELEAIFNPFTRGDRARGGKGTGLGLAIVKRIAAMHGGNVELRNRSGGGLEARVRLPLGLMLPRDAVPEQPGVARCILLGSRRSSRPAAAFLALGPGHIRPAILSPSR
jgi:hypothetical protein